MSKVTKTSRNARRTWRAASWKNCRRSLRLAAMICLLRWSEEHLNREALSKIDDGSTRRRRGKCPCWNHSSSMSFSRRTSNELEGVMNRMTTLNGKSEINLRMRLCSFVYLVTLQFVTALTRRLFTEPLVFFLGLLPFTWIQPSSLPLTSLSLAPSSNSPAGGKLVLVLQYAKI